MEVVGIGVEEAKGVGLWPAHSYIVLEDIEADCYRGSLVEAFEDHNVADIFYRPHSHNMWAPIYRHLPVNSSQVAPLTEKECILLDSIDQPHDRYTFYSTPGKLAWGVGLKVGDFVLAKLPLRMRFGSIPAIGPDEYANAVIRWTDEVLSGRKLYGVEIKDQRYYGCGTCDGMRYGQQLFKCQANCGLYLDILAMKQIATSANGSQYVPDKTQDRVAQLERELREKIQENQQLSNSEQRLRGEVNRLQEQMRVRLATLQNEVAEKDEQLVRERRSHEVALSQVRQEAERYRQQLREEQVQRQQLVARVQAAIGGEAVSPQALELWELPRQEVHISQTILGTGGWGYVARGTFRGQAVAVKCLHRGILSPQNEGRLRREISIMSQVRHPNLLLLIGAVLTVEGAGPLIVTEILDRSLRSAYEEGVPEERSKVPVLRDVSSALTYLHSHRTPIIHRDVSSANVLLEAIRQDWQWKAKLSDFGSANLSHLATTPAEGAAVYAAPEVSTEDRSRQTAKIDVYSFGVLVCEVCLCQFPPERRHFPSMLSEVRGTAPDMFALSRDCTSHAPQDRPAIRDVLLRIDQIIY